MNTVTINAGYTVADNASDLTIRGGALVGRVSKFTGSHPTDISPDGVIVEVRLGSNNRHLNVSNVHNVGWWANKGGTLYDATIFNCGWYSTPDGEGNGRPVYWQNAAGGGRKVTDTCVIVKAFEDGKALATSQDVVHAMDFVRTIFECGRFIVGGQEVGADDITFDDCAFVHCTLALGYLFPNGAVSVTNSLFAAPPGAVCVAVGDQNQKLPESAWERVTFTGNMLIAGGTFAVRLNHNTPEAMAGWTWDHNTYYTDSATPFNAPELGGVMTWTQWRNLGFDLNSHIYPLSALDAPVTRVFAVPERSAANVAIINPGRLASVALPAGVAGTIRDVRNYDVTYTGSAAVMSGDVAAPLNWTGGATDAPLPGATFPAVGVFRIENIEGGAVSADLLGLQDRLNEVGMSIDEALALVNLANQLKGEDDWTRFGQKATLLAQRDDLTKEVKQLEAKLREKQAALNAVDSQLAVMGA